MLVLSRKAGQRIAIGNEITVIVLECPSGRVRIGIEAPPDVPIDREEIAAIKHEFYCESSDLVKRATTNLQRDNHSTTA